MTTAEAKKMTAEQLQAAHTSKMTAYRSLQATTGGKSCSTSARLADNIDTIEREMIRRQSAARRSKTSSQGN